MNSNGFYADLISCLEQHTQLTAITICNSEKKGLDVNTMPPMCAGFRYNDQGGLTRVGVKCIYPSYEEYMNALKNQDIDSWARRAKALLGNQIDFIGFISICSFPLGDNTVQNKIVLSVIDNKDSCISLLLPARPKIFEDDNIGKLHDIVIGYQDKKIPFYGSFNDYSH